MFKGVDFMDHNKATKKCFCGHGKERDMQGGINPQEFYF